MFILALSLCLAAGAQAQPVGASADDESRLPTFAEKPDPTRSDSHAWSAPPNYNFLALVAGIRGHDVTDEQFKEGYARAIERMRADSAFFAESARHLQRTMRRLRASRPDSARSVRVLVYGQSISAEDWWKDVRRHLRATYPHANLTVANKAISGYGAGRLKHAVAQDVVPFAPDLVLFHVYGDLGDYERIIRTIRRRTAAEVALMTDHVTAKQENHAYRDRRSFKKLPALCRKYDLACIDVRGAWKTYLRQNDLDPAALTEDDVHPNPRGNAVMAGIVTDYLDRAAALSDARGPASARAPSMQTTYRAGEDFAFHSDTARVDFTGRRVELVLHEDRAGPLNVRIDGQTPSRFAGCWVPTRPGVDISPKDGPPEKMGVPMTVGLGTAPRAEDWTLTVTEVAPDSAASGRRVRFRLHGSKTGFDGTGTSAAPFRSRSGRITIQPEEWFQRKREDDFSYLDYVEPGDEIVWSVRSMCQSTVAVGADSPVTVAQGLPPGDHTLTLVRSGGAGPRSPVAAVRVYQPPLRE